MYMGTQTLREKYQAFIRNSSEGIWLFEVDKPISTALSPARQIKLMYKYGYMAEANDAMARMYGAESGKDLAGMRLGEFLVESDPQNTDYLQAFIVSGYKLNGVESHEKDRYGNDRIFRNSLTGIIEDGNLLRAWGVQHDITEQYTMHRALQKSEERLALALRASKVGLWEWDVVTGELIWSDELKQLYGLQLEDEVNYEAYQSLIHPQDRKIIQQVIKHSMRTGEDYRVEHRVVWRDGTQHWVMGMGRAFLVDGKAVRMTGTSVSLDDTKRKAELEDVNRKLKIQQDQLMELNHVKDEFIALASHQLRTPATIVKQYLYMLSEGYYGDISDAQRQAVRAALTSNEWQLDIINDLLHVAQLDAGIVVLQKRPVDIVELLRAIVDDHQEKFKSKGQKVIVKSPKPGKSYLSPMLDSNRVRMVLENLLDNAYKYAPAGKPITVAIVKKPKGVAISIADQGIGIRKADIPRLFQKFSRLEHPLSNEVGGTGLGLYWAYKIVDLHGGTITVRSTVDKGSTFTVNLPL